MFFEITTPVGALGLAAESIPAGTRVELERSAVLSGHGRPSVVVSGSDAETVVEAFRADPYVAAFDRLGESNGETVHRLTWGTEVPEFVSRVRETDCTVLSGVGRDETWEFEVRFPTDDDASRFYGGYDDADCPITLGRTSSFGLAGQSERDALTPKQEEALVLALETGYFDVPRRTTLGGVATKLGVSDTATSHRLRRGMANLLRASRHFEATHRVAADDD